MFRNEKCITLIWKIKNFNFAFIKTRRISSPLFFVHEMGGTKWNLCLRPNSSGFKSCIACGIVAKDSAIASYEFEFDYEVSILAGDGSVQQSEIFRKKLYKKGYTDWSAALYLKSDELFSLNKEMFIPDDFLTIRCRMWDRKFSLLLSGRYFAETIIETKCKRFWGTMYNFSSLEPTVKYPVLMYGTAETLNFCETADGKLVIETEQKSLGMYRYEIYIKDIFKNLVKLGQGYIDDSELHYLPLTLSKEHLLKYKRFYLSNDELKIECIITFPEDVTSGYADIPEYGFEYQDSQCTTSETSKNSDVFFKMQYIKNLTTLKNDLTSLFEEGFLCDTKLKTDTDTFPAHTVILSARSTVFKSMFTSDMKEKTSSCVNIDDLDADTVRRMLLFMYSANLDDLEYDSAKSLYFAADQYNIVSLFQRCSNFLKQNILESNCCDILLLADNHDDKDLKGAVIDYIAINDKVVLLSDEWKNLEMNRPQLIIESLRVIWKKKIEGAKSSLSCHR